MWFHHLHNVIQQRNKIQTPVSQPLLFFLFYFFVFLHQCKQIVIVLAAAIVKIMLFCIKWANIKLFVWFICHLAKYMFDSHYYIVYEFVRLLTLPCTSDLCWGTPQKYVPDVTSLLCYCSSAGLVQWVKLAISQLFFKGNVDVDCAWNKLCCDTTTEALHITMWLKKVQIFVIASQYILFVLNNIVIFMTFYELFLCIHLQ